ncbi:MAG: hypothetical protein HQL23_00240 [Candidatus Omnitrophica bacterium]|nr:hypothetical protein [Candidatus Omnitrophota bacterium]
MNSKTTQALKHLHKARELAKNLDNPFKGLTKEGIINQLRASREKLWLEKYAVSSRH